MKANKILAAASATMIAMGMLTVPAMAAPNTSISSTCSICNQAFTKYGGGSTFPETETLTYQDLFSSSDIDSLVNSEKYSYDGAVDYKGNYYQLFVAEYNGSDICFSCLESKVNEANQGSTEPDTDGTHTGSTNVTAEVPGDYTITVPETVALTGDTGSGEKTATVKVTLKGDVAEDQTVTVTVNDPVMKRSGAQDVPVAVTTPKTSWNRNELLNDGTSSDYVVKATLTPGDWTGIMTFECKLA